MTAVTAALAKYPWGVTLTVPTLDPEAVMHQNNTTLFLSTYVVPAVSCSHCQVAITDAVSKVAGVEHVEVDLAAKAVTVGGAGFDDHAVRDAIGEAGYDVTS